MNSRHPEIPPLIHTFLIIISLMRYIFKVDSPNLPLTTSCNSSTLITCEHEKLTSVRTSRRCPSLHVQLALLATRLASVTKTSALSCMHYVPCGEHLTNIEGTFIFENTTSLPIPSPIIQMRKKWTNTA